MSKLSDILKLFSWGPASKIQNQPTVIKLNFRDICIIDRVDDMYSSIKELSLNHNHLTSLNGIEQFRNLEVLNLNFNRIGSRSELLKLASPHLLQELNVRGNPNLISTC